MTPQQVYLLIISFLAIAYSIVLIRDEEMMKSAKLTVHLFLGASIVQLASVGFLPDITLGVSILSSIMMIVAGSLAFAAHRGHAAVVVMFGVLTALPSMVKVVSSVSSSSSSSSSSPIRSPGRRSPVLNSSLLIPPGLVSDEGSPLLIPGNNSPARDAVEEGPNRDIPFVDVDGNVLPSLRRRYPPRLTVLRPNRDIPLVDENGNVLPALRRRHPPRLTVVQSVPRQRSERKKYK